MSYYRNRTIFDRHAYMLNEAIEAGKSDGFSFDDNYIEYIATHKYGDVRDLVYQMDYDYDRSLNFKERHDQIYSKVISTYIVVIVVLSVLLLCGLSVGAKTYFVLNGSPALLLTSLILVGVLVIAAIISRRIWEQTVCKHYYIFGYVSVGSQHLKEWYERMDKKAFVIPYTFCFATDFMTASEWNKYLSLKAKVKRLYPEGWDEVLAIGLTGKRVVNEKLFSTLDDEDQE